MSERDIVAQSVIAEFKKLLYEQDYSLLTRLLLDFLTEAQYSPQLLQKALEIRKEYNLATQDKALIQQELQALLDALDFQATGLPKVPVHHFPTQHTPRLPAPQGAPVCRCTGLVKQYKNSDFKLGPIDLSLFAGELTGVVGENGNGKTTLLRVVAGEILHSSGSIEFPGLKGQNWYQYKNQIAYISQEIEPWHGFLKDNLHFSAANHGIYGQENANSVNYIIHRLGLSRYEDAYWSEISTGFRLRFELAKALVWRPKLLILDEPLANLDINTKLLVLQDLRLLCQSQKYPLSIILSSQQLHEIEKIVDNLIFIKNGEIIFNAPIDQLGSQRKTNTIEVSGNFSREQIYEYLAGIEVLSLTDSGNSFLINLPLEVQPKQVLEQLIKHTEIDYFRDISKSSRKFF